MNIGYTYNVKSKNFYNDTIKKEKLVKNSETVDKLIDRYSKKDNVFSSLCLTNSTKIDYEIKTEIPQSTI